MSDENEKLEPLKRDAKAPDYLTVTFTDPDGNEWGKEVATAKHFKSGSVGFYGNGKLTNPDSKERYQLGCNLTLVGSKPKPTE